MTLKFPPAYFVVVFAAIFAGWSTHSAIAFIIAVSITLLQFFCNLLEVSFPSSRFIRNTTSFFIIALVVDAVVNITWAGLANMS